MLRLILMIVFFLLSLLTAFRAPANILWYVSILVTEFSWIFFSVVVVLLFLRFGVSKYSLVSSIIGVVSLVFFAIPVIEAFRLAPKLFPNGFNTASAKLAASSPFSFRRMITGMNSKQIAYKNFTYDAANGLTLDFYPATTVGKKPCVIIVHGGSWAGGDSRQLPELNSELAKAGYHVASINYRLAPKHKFPLPIEDLKVALTYLRSQASSLLIDTNNFVLLGRSAGGQIVLSAAYMLNDPTIKGVISFYGPADMVWGYANPTNPLVLNSRKVMEDYLGGTYKQVPQQYIQSSATETATSAAAPALLIYGENDPLVSHLHGFRLGKKLDSLGVKHYDVYLPWATHGFDWTLNGPGGQLSTWCVMRFLENVAFKDIANR
ncbi:MAG: alpha/beta hydrolase fold domain-containing protein [Segetibacter sp.]|nr:alpha/beta hydrolase fold domain-containing protein [Segetibacter sp.]